MITTLHFMNPSLADMLSWFVSFLLLWLKKKKNGKLTNESFTVVVN